MGIKNEKLKVLKFKVASPCNESWDKMSGQDGVRFCGSCKQNVYDSSQMTLAEVEAMVNTAGGACMKLFQRKDGTILTKDCGVGLKKRRRKQKIVGLSLAALAGLGGARAMSAPDDTIILPNGIVESMPHLEKQEFQNVLKKPIEDFALQDDVVEWTGEVDIDEGLVEVKGRIAPAKQSND